MANYTLVSGAQFKPFSYQELAAPLDRAEAYHEKLAEEYDKLSSQADILEAMGANAVDKNSSVYNRYKAYSDQLRAEADNLYAHGLNTESRRRLSDLRRMYNTEIVPIQNAWSKREKEAEMQTKAMIEANARGLDMRFSRVAADTPIQSYLENPNQTFRAINGQQITTEVANQFKGLASQIQEGSDGNYWIGKKKLSPIEYSIITQKGMDYNKYMDFINNPYSKDFDNIRGVIEKTLAAHNIEDFDDSTKRAMFQYGALGISSGVGARDMQFHTDPYESKMLDSRLEIEKEAAKARLKETGETPIITSDGVGLKTSEHYTADGLKALGELKGGQNGLKASYFGNKAGQVNPMTIYNDYQNELKKHTKREVVHENGTTMVKDVVDEKKAREIVLSKYSKYGVKDILTTDQYNLLSDMGYNDENNPGGGKARYSAIKENFNKLVQQKNRYSVHMTKYDDVDEDIRGNIQSLSEYEKLSGMLWPIENNGKEGKPINSASDLGLYSADNTKGAKVNGIYYDPEFKGKIVFRLSNGKKYTASPSIINNEIERMIKDAEENNISSKEIAASLYGALNSKNKVQSATDSDI